jgi:hypothetical protein
MVAVNLNGTHRFEMGRDELTVEQGKPAAAQPRDKVRECHF